MPNYTPEKGDFIVATFDPQSGHEQKGRRPALVISNSLFNEATGLTIVCPITNTNRNIPFHIEVSEKSSLTGFIMVEQVKSIDYISRRVKFIEKANSEILNEVLSVLDACIYQNA
ncbi:MAG: type II toxin-antitoxin system PemK/MazF family toxin [Methylococcales symbiont of Iophon sp. n. MRB-2018]|nr:MAG: type II toxin-antitoxin system PemK/MazF family toxin [Methylococcales symbiont of Iophon sp. n. MRB-2018]KAF3980581.1 MAG: type II toxin-antitoxin system PemK/MazF family toxin [Methylococcales symbiont of Iophon sp. n. MRB-2018]